MLDFRLAKAELAIKWNACQPHTGGLIISLLTLRKAVHPIIAPET